MTALQLHEMLRVAAKDCAILRKQYEALKSELEATAALLETKNQIVEYLQTQHRAMNNAAAEEAEAERISKAIPKDQLTHDRLYRGACRNAAMARWNAHDQMFWYVRHKLGSSFDEGIRHITDCARNEDGFLPLELAK